MLNPKRLRHTDDEDHKLDDADAKKIMMEAEKNMQANKKRRNSHNGDDDGVIERY